MATPIEHLSNLVIGSVESVSPDDIKVLLELDAPHSVALNSGTPTPFPRLNAYVLIPNEAGSTVGYIAWIGIERSPYPKRSGFKDFGLIDLPFPLRKMSVSPLGTLCSRRDKDTGTVRYELSRGVVAFPSVGDQVLVPTPEQIEAIVGAKDSDKRVRIGASPMAANATIMVDPDKLFGRHLAILGNTGSGKSCSVAGLIRWSIEASQKALDAGEAGRSPNARFIVLDPNGEYARAFADFGEKLRLFRVPPVSGRERPLDVPAWLWNGHEWTSMAHAQPGAQRPLLLQGLRELKSGRTEGVPREAMIRRYLTSYTIRISAMLSIGTQAFAGAPRARFECARLLETIRDDTNQFADTVEEPTKSELSSIASTTSGVVEARRSGNFFNDFSVSDLETIRDQLTALTVTLPDINTRAPISEDAPLFFDVNLLAEHLERIATEQGGNLAAFISTLGLRIRGMLADQRLGAVINREPPTSFQSWLDDYVGADKAANGPIAVIDLSLVPSEVIHIVVSVLGRLIFEALQRYRRQSEGGKTLPTVLVLEEAHTFVRRSGNEDSSEAVNPNRLCRESFERIAREGRKFGLGLVLSSQRPSELSPTVLAQCNTFLLHRIVNDSDQSLVSRLVPDNVGALLKELPSLPSRQAILLGWAAPIPVLVEMDELPEDQRPHSADPDFWKVWTLAEERAIDWPTVTADWAATPDQDEG
jgi:DNA helicase HerA-like ATPase